MINRLLFLIVATCAIAQSSERLPAALLAETSRDPAGFIRVLADNAIPAGLEIREADVQPRARQRVDLDRRESTDASQVIASFNRVHADYQAALVDGVIVIRPAKRMPDYLDQPAQVGQFTSKGLMPAVKKVFAPLDPKLGGGGGELGSYLGPVGITVDHGEQADVTVDARGVTTLSVLNHIARQAPGHPWLVVVAYVEDAPRIVRVGFVHRYDTTTEVSVIQP
jgi:hypothetical protein